MLPTTNTPKTTKRAHAILVNNLLIKACEDITSIVNTEPFDIQYAVTNLHNIVSYLNTGITTSITHPPVVMKQTSVGSLALTDNELCQAQRVTGDRCTRRKKENSIFCGTHQNSVHTKVWTKQDKNDISMDTKNPKGTPVLTTTPRPSSKSKQSARSIARRDPSKTHEVVLKKIRGIMYYTDTYGNLFSPDAILHGQVDPPIIGSFIEKDGETTIYLNDTYNNAISPAHYDEKYVDLLTMKDDTMVEMDNEITDE